MQEPGGLVRSFENTAEGGMRAFDNLRVTIRHPGASDGTEGGSNEAAGHIGMEDDHLIERAIAIIPAPEALLKIFVANTVTNGGATEDGGVRG